MTIYLNNGNIIDLIEGVVKVEQIRDETYIISHRTDGKANLYYIPIRSVLYIRS